MKQAQTQICRGCGRTNKANAKFCGGCGDELVGNVCGCGAKLAANAKFCSSCGINVAGLADLSKLDAELRPDASGGGELAENRWLRNRTDFAIRVDAKTLEGKIGKTIKVETGTRAILVKDGKVTEVLGAGAHKVVGVLQSWFSFLGRATIELVLVDAAAVLIPCEIGNIQTTDGEQFAVTAAAQLELTDPEKLLSSLMVGRSGLDHAQLRDEILPIFKPTASNLLSQQASVFNDQRERERLEGELTQTLHKRLQKTGLSVTGVLVTPGKGSASLAFTITSMDAPSGPQIVTCGRCQRANPSTAKFCGGCGDAVQRPADARPAQQIFTSDPAEVEFDVALRVGISGPQAPPELKSALFQALRGACRQLAHQFTLDALTQDPDAASDFEMKLLEIMTQTAQHLQISLTSLRVVDIRRKGGEWMLQARAEMEKTRQEMEIGRAWMVQAGEELDLKILADEMALRRRRSMLDAQMRTKSLELEGARGLETLSIEDREARIPLLDRALKAEHVERLLNAQSAEEWDIEAGRLELNKFLRRQDIESLRTKSLADTEDRSATRNHLQRLLKSQRDYEAAQLQQTQSHSITGRESTFMRDQRRLAMSLASEEHQQTLSLEAMTQRQQKQLEVEDDLADMVVAAKGLEVARQAQQLQHQDLEARRRIARDDELARAQAAHQQEMMMRDQLKGMSVQQLLAITPAEQGTLIKELALTEQFSGMTPEQILAANPNVNEAAAAALQARFINDAGQMKLFFEKILAERETSQSGLLGAQRHYTDKLEALYRQSAAMQHQDKSQLMEMFKALSQQQAQILGAAVNSERHHIDRRLEDSRAHQADVRALSTDAMQQMGHVAGHRAANHAALSSPESAPTPTQSAAQIPANLPTRTSKCPQCGEQCMPESKFCEGCGMRLS